MKNLLLVLALAALVLSQNCPSAGTIASFVTGFGANNVAQLPNGNEAFCYTQNFPTTFSQIPRVGVALTSFESNPSTDFFLSVRPLPQNSTSSVTFAVRTFNSITRWTKLSVTYIAENSPDVEVGEGLIDVLALTGCSNNRQLSTSVATTTNWATKRGASPVVRIFISGFQIVSAGSGAADLRLSNAVISGKSVSFTVSSQSQLSDLSVTYLVVDSAVFSNVGSNQAGFERNQLIGSAQISLIGSYRYTLFGLSGVTLSSNFNPSFNVVLSSTALTVSTQSSLAYVNVNYIQLGQIQSFTSCQSCQGYPFNNNGQCVAACPVPTQNVNGNCIACPANSFPDGRGNCNCQAPYVRINGNCALCAPGTTYNAATQSCQLVCPTNSVLDQTGTCVCIPPYVRSGANCVPCAPGTTYNTATQSCQVQCPPNSVVDSTGTCVCFPPFVRNGAACVPCSPGTQYNSTTQSCRIVCPPNSVPDNFGNNCNCIPPYFKSNGNCIQCSAGTQYNPNTQSCQNIVVCGPNSSPDASGNCVCNPPFVKFANGCGQCPNGYTYNATLLSCQLNSQCSGNSVSDGRGGCICRSPLVNISGTCGQCPSGAQYNAASKTCIITVNPTCPEHSKFDSSYGQCVCEYGYISFQGSCILQSTPSCPANAYYDGTSCVCTPGLYLINGFCATCPIGYTYTNGACQLTNYNPCPEFSTYDLSVLKCVCNTDYVVLNGACGKCPTGTRYDGTTCVSIGGGFPCSFGTNCQNYCATKPNTVFDQATFSCICQNGFYNISGSCQTCGPNQVFSNGACVSTTTSSCAAGTYFDNMEKKCLNCASGCNQCTNAIQCSQCAPGWTLDSRTKLCTEICGDGVRFVLECDDGNNINGDGCSSKCKIEKGFSCQGGTPTSKDICTNTRPSSIILTPTGQTREFGKINANVRCNWLPSNFTSPNCGDLCNNILLVNVTSGINTTPSISAKYIIGTSYTFSVSFLFGREPIADFSASVQINPLVAQYFPGMDISQVVILKLVPSQMAKTQKTETLVLEEEP